MISNELDELLSRESFEPFRMKLVNGDIHDVFDPNTVSVHALTVYIASHDQNWTIFPLDKINSLESLIADYHGKSGGAAEE